MGKKTIKDWEKVYGVRVIDPDGFNRKDPKLYEKEFTQKEFERGLVYSSIWYTIDSKVNSLLRQQRESKREVDVD